VHVRPAKVCTVVLCTLLSQASKGVLTATWADAAIIHDHIVKSATHFEEILDVLGVAAVDSREKDAEPVLQNPKAAFRIFSHAADNVRPLALGSTWLDIFERGDEIASRRVSTVAQRIT
jgi:hypothetical protein